jgi:ketol-acid reductoisomerase
MRRRPRADIIMLLPDEFAPEIYRTSIAPHLKAGKTLVLASGYNITYKFILPPSDVEVVLVAPRMIGQRIFTGLYEHRMRFEDGRWKIAAKKTVLVNDDEVIDNLTFLV